MTDVPHPDAEMAKWPLLLTVGTVGDKNEGSAPADRLLLDGTPLGRLGLVVDPKMNFLVIMNDGKIYKNALSKRGPVRKETFSLSAS